MVTLVSVLICSYNSAKTIEAALDSVFNQTLAKEDYEVLLVDDGSTDNTSEIADRYSSQFCNFRYVQFPVNRGLVAACNYGIKAALGKYLVRLDADDQFDPDILSSLVEPLERGDSDFACCDRYEVDLRSGSRTLVEIEPFNLFKLIAVGVMMRTDMLLSIGGYRPVFWEEFDMYIRYLQQSDRPPTHIPKPHIFYSRHPSSMTANPERVEKGWRELRTIWGDDVLRSYGWREVGQEVLN